MLLEEYTGEEAGVRDRVRGWDLGGARKEDHR